MPNWKKVVTSGSAAELSTLSLTGLSAQNSETDVLTINTSNVLGTRQLGSNAFNSTTIPTDNDQLDNGAGYTTNTGTVTSISTGNANTLTKSGTTSVTLTPNVGSVTNGGGNLATGNDIYDHVTSRISGLTSNTGTVDTTGTVNANEFARFNDSNTLEALTVAETKTALSLNNVPNSDHTAQGYSTVTQLNASSSALQDGITTNASNIDGKQATLTFGISNTNAVKINSTSVADDEYARFTANGLESRSTSEVLSDIGGQAALTFGKSSGNALKSEEALTTNDILLMGSSNVKGRTYAELKSDLSLNNVPNSDHTAQGYSTVTQLNASSSALQTNINAKHDTIDSSNRLSATLIGANGNISNTEYGYLNGVTSAIQTQLDAKQATLTFGISNTNVLRANSNVANNDFLRVDGTSIEGRTAAELKSDLSLNNVPNSNHEDAGYATVTQLNASSSALVALDAVLQDGITTNESAISGKHPTINSGNRLNANLIGSNGNISNTEYGYLNGVSSNIQTQLNAKQASLTFGLASGNALRTEEALSQNDILLAGADEVKGRTYAELKSDISLNNVTNESKTTMFTRPSFTGDVTASGAISASGLLSGDGLFLPQMATIEWLSNAGQTQTIKGTDNYIQIDGDNRVLVSADNDMTITTPLVAASGNISASGNFIGNRQFDSTSTVSNDTTHGDITYTGGQGTIAAGDIVYLDTSGNWQRAQANSTTKSIGLLGIALGEEASAQGILLRGMFTLDHNVGSNAGVPLYLDDTAAAQARTSAPATSGDIVRVIGYTVGTNYQIWFNPDGAFVEVA